MLFYWAFISYHYNTSILPHALNYVYILCIPFLGSTCLFFCVPLLYYVASIQFRENLSSLSLRMFSYYAHASTQVCVELATQNLLMSHNSWMVSSITMKRWNMHQLICLSPPYYKNGRPTQHGLSIVILYTEPCTYTIYNACYSNKRCLTFCVWGCWEILQTCW